MFSLPTFVSYLHEKYMIFFSVCFVCITSNGTEVFAFCNMCVVTLHNLKVHLPDHILNTSTILCMQICYFIQIHFMILPL